MGPNSSKSRPQLGGQETLLMNRISIPASEHPVRRSADLRLAPLVQRPTSLRRLRRRSGASRCCILCYSSTHVLLRKKQPSSLPKHSGNDDRFQCSCQQAKYKKPLQRTQPARVAFTVITLPQATPLSGLSRVTTSLSLSGFTSLGPIAERGHSTSSADEIRVEAFVVAQGTGYQPVREGVWTALPTMPTHVRGFPRNTLGLSPAPTCFTLPDQRTSLPAKARRRAPPRLILSVLPRLVMVIELIVRRLGALHPRVLRLPGPLSSSRRSDHGQVTGFRGTNTEAPLTSNRPFAVG